MTARLSGGGGNGLPSTVSTKTADYTAVTGDFVQVNAASGGVTITLPSSPSTGALVAVKKVDSTSNTVTIAPPGGGTIDGDANATTTTQWAGAVFEHVGSNAWRIATSMTTSGRTGPTGSTGATGATGSTGAAGPSGTYHGRYPCGVTGRWYMATSATHTDFNATAITAGTLVLGSPFIAQNSFTIDTLACYLSALSSAGGLLRFGLYEVDDQTNPFAMTLSSAYATLVEDLGTIATDGGGTGHRTKALSAPLVISSGYAFCIGLVPQSQDATIHLERGGSMAAPAPFGLVESWGALGLGLTVTGVTGALPATFTPSAIQGSSRGGGGFFKRSA